MTPDGLSGLVGFLVLIAPGALYEIMVSRGRPLVRTTTFREVNRVVLVSIATWILPGLLFTTYGFWGTQDALIEALGGATDPATIRRAAWLGLGLLAVALSQAFAIAKWHTKEISDVLVEGTAWEHVLRRDRQPGVRRYLWVTMSDGSVWGGFYHIGTVRDLPPGERDLVLAEPIKRRPPSSRDTVDTDYHRLAIMGPSVASIAVTHVEDPAGVDDLGELA